MNKEQIKSIIQLLFGSGGPAASLILSYGVPADKLNLWVNLALAIIPPLAMGVWALIERTHKGTLASAGAILEKPTLNGDKTGTIIVSQNAGNGAAAAAVDPNVKNVNFQAHWSIIALAFFILPFLGACTMTGSQGTPVTVTSQNLLPLIAAKLVQGCAYYNANTVSVVVLTKAVEQAANASANVSGNITTVENLAALTCALLAPPPATLPATSG